MHTTSYKAFAFGIGATLAIALSLHQAQLKTERAASIKTLEPVVINIKRSATGEADAVKRLPTVYITGKRAGSATDGRQAVWSGGLPARG